MSNPMLMLEPENASLAAFPDWPLHRHLAAWRKAHRKRRIEPGAIFIAPDGQHFIVTSRIYWRYADRKKPSISLVWKSACAICGDHYTFNQPLHSGRMVRTCPAHRGAYRTAHKASRQSPLQSMIAQYMAIYPRGEVTISAFIDRACAILPDPEPGQRDTRRQRIAAALRAMARKGTIPSRAALGAELVAFG